MTQKLAKTPSGRVVLHLVIVLDHINHFRNPHLGFFGAAVVRFVKGIG
jgi:hypothetical protein